MLAWIFDGVALVAHFQHRPKRGGDSREVVKRRWRSLAPTEAEWRPYTPALGAERTR